MKIKVKEKEITIKFSLYLIVYLFSALIGLIEEGLMGLVVITSFYRCLLS